MNTATESIIVDSPIMRYLAMACVLLFAIMTVIATNNGHVAVASTLVAITVPCLWLIYRLGLQSPFNAGADWLNHHSQRTQVRFLTVWMIVIILTAITGVLLGLQYVYTALELDIFRRLFESFG